MLIRFVVNVLNKDKVEMFQTLLDCKHLTQVKDQKMAVSSMPCSSVRMELGETFKRDHQRIHLRPYF